VAPAVVVEVPAAVQPGVQQPMLAEAVVSAAVSRVVATGSILTAKRSRQAGVLARCRVLAAWW
jgi:hypothetical protein